MFIEEKECFVFRRVFSKAGENFTQCMVKMVLSPEIAEPYARFNTNNEEEQRYSIIAENNLSNFVNEVNDYLKKKREEEKFMSSEYIEIFATPSRLALEIMAKNDLSYLTIIDSPGVSREYEKVQIEYAHLIMFVLTDNDIKTAHSGFKKIIEEIAYLTPTSDACFLYNLKTVCDDKDEYNEMQTTAKIAMESFEKEFEPLRNTIIGTSLNIMYPSRLSLGIPGMKSNRINTAEKLFRQDLVNVINNSFDEDKDEINLIVEELRNEFNKVAEDKKSKTHIDLVNFMRTILFNIPRFLEIPLVPSNLEIPVLDCDYLEEFKKEKHARVKSQDKYRIVEAVSHTKRRVLGELYAYFNKYTFSNVPDVLKQLSIKLFYYMICKELKNGSGLGIGTHFQEDYPPITMRAIEYIFASELYKEFRESKDEKEIVYRRVLENNGILSKSWDSVIIIEDNLYILDILTNCGILSLPSKSLDRLIENRYIGGLRKIGEYKAWREYIHILSGSYLQNYQLYELLRETGI